MITLLANDYTAVRWTGASQAIASSAWASLIVKVYAHNLITNAGYNNYIPSNQFPSLTRFEPGIDYLIYASAAYTLADAMAAPDGAFSAFAGYTPASGSTTPAVPTAGPGFIAGATAAAPIVGGTLVARTADGLVPYSASTLDLIHLLFGVALNSALPGGAVSVQRGGYVPYPGLGLTPDSTLFAGDNGRLVTSNTGMAFSQIVGRAISADEFIYQPESVLVLYPFSLSAP